MWHTLAQLHEAPVATANAAADTPVCSVAGYCHWPRGKEKEGKRKEKERRKEGRDRRREEEDKERK